MKKINLKKPLIVLGKPVIGPDNEPQHIHQEIAFFVNSMNTGNPVKNTSLCLRIYEKGELEIDQPDFDFLKKNITECRNAPDYLLSAALQCLDEAEEVKE